MVRCAPASEGFGVNVRIIAGLYGGRTIQGSVTRRTHPMSERIRNALFNMLTGELEGADVLDAFAGSGALGLEALSRGAASAVFIEKDRRAQKIIQNNIELLHADDTAKLIRSPVSSVIKTLDRQFDVIFVDPPYHDTQLSTVEKLFPLLKPNGLMVLSHTGRCEAPTKLGVVVVDNRSYGNALLTSFRRG